jgi:uncharacterized membrane protein
MWLIRYPYADIISRTARDVHPPAYYLLAKPWVSIFGNSIFSIRFLSLLFSVGIVFLVYLIVKEIWDERSAFWSSMLVAFSPFMIRFAQEARMYGVVAFFTTLATYFFVKFIKERNDKYLLLYVPAMAVAMYTQYYSFFVIISHWVIMALFTPEIWPFHWIKGIKEKAGVFNYKWWLANISLLILYLPWFPVAYRQVTRVSGSYWILPEWITIRTVPNNILQFITYTHFDKIFFSNIGPIIYWLTIALLVFSGLYLIAYKNKIRTVLSLYVFGYLPMLLVFTLSKLRTPIYQDRYFPFSALALFAIWGIVIASINNNFARKVVGISAITVLSIGIYIMHIDVNHQMKQLKVAVDENKQSDDVLLSGELYTFLDGSYYFGYKNIRFLSNPVDGYGESSLFYDQQEDFVVSNSQKNYLGDRIWVIGKTGEKDYYSPKLWEGWNIATIIENNGLKAVLYTR